MKVTIPNKHRDKAFNDIVKYAKSQLGAEFDITYYVQRVLTEGKRGVILKCNNGKSWITQFIAWQGVKTGWTLQAETFHIEV